MTKKQLVIKAVLFVLLTPAIALVNSSVLYYTGLMEAHTPRIALSFIIGAVLAVAMTGDFYRILFAPVDSLSDSERDHA